MPFIINNSSEPDFCGKDEELIANDREIGAEKKEIDEFLFSEFINYDEEPTEQNCEDDEENIIN